MAARNWTSEQRLRQREAIQRWQPWAKSTGPRSAEGKQSVARNAMRHGGRSAEMTAYLRQIREFLKQSEQRLR